MAVLQCNSAAIARGEGVGLALMAGPRAGGRRLRHRAGSDIVLKDLDLPWARCVGDIDGGFGSALGVVCGEDQRTNRASGPSGPQESADDNSSVLG